MKDLLLLLDSLQEGSEFAFCSPSCPEGLWYPSIFLCNGHSVLVFGGEADHTLPCVAEIWSDRILVSSQNGAKAQSSFNVFPLIVPQCWYISARDTTCMCEEF